MCSLECVLLVGGFKHFLCSALFEEDSRCDYFSKGLKPPTSLHFFCNFFDFFRRYLGSPTLPVIVSHPQDQESHPVFACLGGGFKYFLFPPLLREDSQFD